MNDHMNPYDWIADKTGLGRVQCKTVIQKMLYNAPLSEAEANVAKRIEPHYQEFTLRVQTKGAVS